MKLSKAQKEILKLMNNSWELGLTNGWRGYDYWLQKNGLGKGGETKRNINFKTIYKLMKLELIEIKKDGFPTKHYGLTKKGKQLLEELK